MKSLKEMNIGCHNEFEFVVRDAITGEIKRTEKAFNIILNNFWANFITSGSSAPCFTNIVYGSGTAAPVATDVALTAKIGYKAIVNKTYDWSTYAVDGIVKVKGNIRLEAADNVGASISEVGLSTNGTIAITKSLLKDANGNVISIVKTDLDVVDIYATFYIKTPIGQGIKLTELSYGIIGWMTFRSTFDTYTFDWANETTINITTSAITVAYDAVNKKVTATLADMIAANGNVSGLTRMINRDTFEIALPRTGFLQPTIIKEVVGTGDGAKKGFKGTFGRIKDTANLKAYVNDVEAAISYSLFGLNPALVDMNGVMTLLSQSTYERVYENTYHEKAPITSVYGRAYTVYTSTDNVNWTQVAQDLTGNWVTKTFTSTGKYLKHVVQPGGYAFSTFYNAAHTGGYQVFLTNPPANGATVTLSYDTNCIAKDAQHVLKGMTVILNFNEYTPA